MPSFGTILYAQCDGVATITLNRPASLNALSRQMALELCEALELARAEPAVRAVVLHGAGEAFCAGGDMHATHSVGPRDAATIEAAFEPFRQLTLALHDFDRPVVAAAQGVAYGAGFSLLLLCDIVLLATTARLCMAFQRIGAVPDCGAMYTLPRIVGMQRAKELMLSARELGAAEAQRLGLSLETHEPSALLGRAREIATAFRGASASAVRMTKRGLNASAQMDLQGMLNFEGAAQGTSFSSDYVEDAARRFAVKESRTFTWPKPRSANGKASK